jgi:protocatechuate 3,4-dioxygenase beta subunit
VSNASKLVVPLLLLAAAAGGTAWYLSQQTHDPQPAPVQPVEQPKVEPKPEPVLPAAVPVVTTQDPVRTERNPTTDGNAHADAPQGVLGRVLLPNGAPAAGVPVFLMESAMANPIELFLAQKSGKVKPPQASTATQADGTFRIGVRKAGSAVDLRIASPDHPEFHQPNVKVNEGDWYDVKDVTLETGTLVTGRVVDANSKAPVPNATVYLASSHQSHTMLAVPGRERGMQAVTDGTGSFRYTNGPRSGLINLVAEAEGFASAQILNQQIRTDAANDYTLEVEAGQPIAGICVDPTGAPVGSVRLDVIGLSAKTPMSATTSSEPDGRFQFTNLRPGPYQLTATSTQFAELRLPVVLTGDSEVKVVLTKRGIAHLQVLAANGQEIKSYSLSLKRYFANNPLGIANVPEWTDRRINPGDYRATDGKFASIGGLPTGDFRFQITDSQHAKTLSPPFTIAEGGVVVEVVATMTLGGTITGTVIDDTGKPIANANVSSDMNGGIAADTGLFEIFGKMMPEKHSKLTVKTDGQGRFRIAKLSFADYMVRAAHPDYCEGTAINLKLESEGQVLDAGVIQLAKGAIVEGFTTIGGQPTGQVKVTFSVPMNAESLPGAGRGDPNAMLQPGPAKILFNASAYSDGDGRFRLIKRVPPGTYRATAQRPSVGNDMFTPMLDAKETAKEIVVAPGQEYVQVTFDLPRR